MGAGIGARSMVVEMTGILALFQQQATSDPLPCYVGEEICAKWRT